MSTTIEWTQRPGTKGETWNPVVGCTKVSAGCKHCYAKTMHDKRHKAYLAGKLQNIPQYAQPFEKVHLMPQRLTLPLKWKKPRTVFVNSVSDLFHADVPFEFIDQVFAVMALTPQHTYQILTKRPERMAEYFARVDTYTVWLPTSDISAEVVELEHPLPNVWLGTSVENQATADERIPHLLRCPAAVRFLSCEPLLGAVDTMSLNGPGHCLYQVLQPVKGHRPAIDWVITGGESGPGARPMHPDWARSLRDQCKADGVPFFFKQWGAYQPGSMDGKGLVVLNNGKAEDYSIGPDVRLKYSTSEWAALKPEVMSRVGKKNAGHLLDGVEHHEWPKLNSAKSITQP